MNKMLTFNEELHEYRLDGVVIPSVTQIIQWVFRSFDHVNRSILEEASWRGMCVHKAVELFELGVLDMSTVGKQIIPYFEAWLLFKKQTGYEVYKNSIERHSFHPVFKYGLTPDNMGLMNKRTTLVDIKTGDHNPIHGVQLFAYKEALNCDLPREDKVQCMITVQLKNNGKYSIKEYKDKTDWNTFMCAMSIYNWKGNNQ